MKAPAAVVTLSSLATVLFATAAVSAQPAAAVPPAVAPAAAPPAAAPPAPLAPGGSVGAVGRREATGSTSTLETAPSPVQAGTSVAAPGLPPLPPPYPETTEPVDPGKAGAPTPPEEKKPKDPRSKAPSATLENWLAFRYTWYRLTGSDRDRSADSFQASFAYDSSSTLLGAATRFTLAGAIGSGAGQADGLIQGSLLIGMRTNPRGTQGVLARLGVAGSYGANANWLRSWLELPRGEVGYQLLDRRSLVELTGHAGASLTGRFDPGATLFRATPVTLAWGGSGTVQVDPVRFAIDYTRTEASGTGPDTPLDEVAGNICTEPFSSILLCAEAAQTWGDVQDAGGNAYSVKALRIGFTVGLGSLAHRSAVQTFEPKTKTDGDED